MQTLMQVPTLNLVGDIFSGYRYNVEPLGNLGLLLSVCMQQRRTPTPRQIEDACQTDIVLRHTCDVTRLAILGAADGLVAVGFEANVISRSTDPVDVLMPWNMQCNVSVLHDLARAVQAMLHVEGWAADEQWQRIADGMRELEKTPPIQTSASVLLWRQVCAANIRLCIRAARDM